MPQRQAALLDIKERLFKAALYLLIILHQNIMRSQLPNGLNCGNYQDKVMLVLRGN